MSDEKPESSPMSARDICRLGWQVEYRFFAEKSNVRLTGVAEEVTVQKNPDIGIGVKRATTADLLSFPSA